ncbi:DUF805 domain-containing protein [Parvularcula sp. ZS-1/3]|uniref:DUF805 domain-containing protein n=1 Tax=Parvularcula mediterranea TaxID=2732508 RepID=A0A7Y3W3T2_9PROT|nr:DUF805 domain-containing protein [Parvularcula mediterranea]NNU15080.1 DUF805 domain-containing protein [Parvularcula mediterranea]
MRGIVIDPRGRIRRSRFLWDLIMPNIGALIAIGFLRSTEAPIADAAIGGILVLLLWAGNFAAPIARLHDLGVPAAVHFAALVAIFLFGTIGPVGSFEELSMRVTDWLAVLTGEDSQVPAVGGDSQRIAGIIALVQVLVLSLVPGKSGPNRFGPDPKDKT